MSTIISSIPWADCVCVLCVCVCVCVRERERERESERMNEILKVTKEHQNQITHGPNTNICPITSSNNREELSVGLWIVMILGDWSLVISCRLRINDNGFLVIIVGSKGPLSLGDGKREHRKLITLLCDLEWLMVPTFPSLSHCSMSSMTWLTLLSLSLRRTN